MHKYTRVHTVNHALLSVCGKRPSELFLALTASRVPSSLFLSPLSPLFSLSLSHSQGCQAALTMNQSCVRLFDCSWGSVAEGVLWMQSSSTLCALYRAFCHSLTLRLSPGTPLVSVVVSACSRRTSFSVLRQHGRDMPTRNGAQRACRFCAFLWCWVTCS